MKKNAQWLFNENEQNNNIRRSSRFKLMQHLCTLIDEEYGGLSSLSEIKEICEAVITLFPCLKDPKGGIVIE